MNGDEQPLVQAEAEMVARYPWFGELHERDTRRACNTQRAAAASSAPDAKMVLPLILGGQDLSIPLTRHRACDELPADQTVCYVDKGGGSLIVALYRNGKWLNRSGRPLPGEPEYWFKIGARD